MASDLRNGGRLTLHPSAAETATNSTGVFWLPPGADTIRSQLNVTAATGTSPTLAVIIEDSLDGGSTWNTIGTFTSATGVTRQVINIPSPFGELIRVTSTLGGTTPNFTYSVETYVDVLYSAV